VTAVLVVAALACAQQAPAQPPLPLLVVEDFSLDIADATIRGARGMLDPEGAGSSTDVQAVLQQGTGSQATEGPSTDRPPTEITAERSSWDLKTREVRFEGDVVVTRGGFTLRCGRLTVQMSDAERVSHALAEEDVVISQDGRRATGARAELHPETGQVVLEGAPVVEEGPHRMRGERVVLWLDDERMECERCSIELAPAALSPTEGSVGLP